MLADSLVILAGNRGLRWNGAWDGGMMYYFLQLRSSLENSITLLASLVLILARFAPVLASFFFTLANFFLPGNALANLIAHLASFI